MNNPHQNARLAEVLLVEDSENDVILTREGFLASKFHVNLHTVENGRDCMAFLRRQPPFENAPAIDLILLDLNLPIMDGREVLAAINKDDALKHLPVVVLTTSSAEMDVLRMYKLRCSSYITKPVKFERFLEIIAQMENYWLTIVTLPHATSPKPG
ncbi:MAG: response regulator [Verrucomicrobia bacterium]|nr:response regulator [Verrucomicrobiota bacterium]